MPDIRTAGKRNIKANIATMGVKAALIIFRINSYYYIAKSLKHDSAQKARDARREILRE